MSDKKKRGRPENPYYNKKDKRIHIRVTEAEEEALKDLAKWKNKSASQVLRDLILNEYLNNLDRFS